MKGSGMNDTPLIPTYLKPLAVRASCRKQVTDFYLRCDGCGGETFAVLRDRQEQDPIDMYLHSFKFPVMSWDVSAEDKKGRRRITVRTFFGIPMGRIYLDELYPNGFKAKRDYVKAKCLTCQKEHVIFDGWCHGLDALTDDPFHVPAPENRAPQAYRTLRKSCRVNVTLIHERHTAEEIGKGDDPVPPEYYAEAFSIIAVYAANEGKQRQIFICDMS